MDPTPHDPRVAVVILNYNGLRYIPDCLESVLADVRESGLSTTVLFADNASGDGSVEFVRRRYPGVRVIANAGNLGFPRGCNEAARLTTSEIIVLLNMDTRVERGWLRALVDALDAYPNAVITGSKLFLGDGVHLQHAGGVIHANLNTSHVGYNETDDGRFDAIRPCSYLTGASVAIRRSFLEAVGWLDEGYPLYFEDADLCIQARRLGRDCLFVPASRAIHYETVGTVYNSSRYTYRYNRGRVRCALKNLNMRQVVRRWLPAEIRWWRDAWLPANPGAILRAYLSNLAKLPMLLIHKRFGVYRDLLRRGWEFRPD